MSWTIWTSPGWNKPSNETVTIANGVTKTTTGAYTEQISATLTVTPTSVAAGGTVTATFSNISSPTAADWIGLYVQGVADTAG